jgi:uncharacterized membrane protein
MRNILLLFYIVINVFLYVLNFELFNTSTSIELGFTSFTAMPILLMLFLGMFFIALFYWLDHTNQHEYRMNIEHLNDQIKLHEKDLEIMSLKHLNQEQPNVISPEKDNDANTNQT